MEVSNMHVAGLLNRIVIFRNELDKSVSQSMHSMRTPDTDRIETYINVLKGYKDHVMSQDPLDLPHWHDRKINVPDLPAPIDTENPALLDMIYLLEVMYVELAKSQSNDLPSGLVVFDSDRFDKQYTNLIAFINDFIRSSTPVDMPEAASGES